MSKLADEIIAHQVALLIGVCLKHANATRWHPSLFEEDPKGMYRLTRMDHADWMVHDSKLGSQEISGVRWTQYREDETRYSPIGGEIQLKIHEAIPIVEKLLAAGRSMRQSRGENLFKDLSAD